MRSRRMTQTARRASRSTTTRAHPGTHRTVQSRGFRHRVVGTTWVPTNGLRSGGWADVQSPRSGPMGWSNSLVRVIGSGAAFDPLDLRGLA